MTDKKKPLFDPAAFEALLKDFSGKGTIQNFPEKEPLLESWSKKEVWRGKSLYNEPNRQKTLKESFNAMTGVLDIQSNGIDLMSQMNHFDHPTDKHSAPEIDSIIWSAEKIAAHKRARAEAELAALETGTRHPVQAAPKPRFRKKPRRQTAPTS